MPRCWPLAGEIKHEGMSSILSKAETRVLEGALRCSTDVRESRDKDNAQRVERVSPRYIIKLLGQVAAAVVSPLKPLLHC